MVEQAHRAVSLVIKIVEQGSYAEGSSVEPLPPEALLLASGSQDVVDVLVEVDYPMDIASNGVDEFGLSLELSVEFDLDHLVFVGV